MIFNRIDLFISWRLNKNYLATIQQMEKKTPNKLILPSIHGGYSFMQRNIKVNIGQLSGQARRTNINGEQAVAQIVCCILKKYSITV